MDERPTPEAMIRPRTLHWTWHDFNQPQRIQLSRRRGWRKPENTVVVARPHILGNPFRVHRVKEEIDPWQVVYEPNPSVDHRAPHRLLAAECATKAEAVAIAVDLYRDWATSGPNHYHRVLYFIDTHNLRGKNLACWCPLDQPCHADVLLELANDPARVP